MCGFNLIGVERLRHHRPEIVLFSMKEGSVGGCLLQEGVNDTRKLQRTEVAQKTFQVLSHPKC